MSFDVGGDSVREAQQRAEANHSYRYYARLTRGDEIPSVWCGDIDGPNVSKVREHRTMVAARLYAALRNFRRPAPKWPLRPIEKPPAERGALELEKLRDAIRDALYVAENPAKPTNALHGIRSILRAALRESSGTDE